MQCDVLDRAWVCNQFIAHHFGAGEAQEVNVTCRAPPPLQRTFVHPCVLTCRLTSTPTFCASLKHCCRHPLLPLLLAGARHLGSWNCRSLNCIMYVAFAAASAVLDFNRSSSCTVGCLFEGRGSHLVYCFVTWSCFKALWLLHCSG